MWRWIALARAFWFMELRYLKTTAKKSEPQQNLREAPVRLMVLCAQNIDKLITTSGWVYGFREVQAPAYLPDPIDGGFVLRCKLQLKSGLIVFFFRLRWSRSVRKDLQLQRGGAYFLSIFCFCLTHILGSQSRRKLWSVKTELKPFKLTFEGVRCSIDAWNWRKKRF